MNFAIKNSKFTEFTLAVGFAGVVDDSPKNQIRKTYYPTNNPDVEVEDVDDETFTEKIKEESKKIK